MARNAKNGRNLVRTPSGKETDPGGGAAVAAVEESPYKYYDAGEKVRSDGAFFELLLSKVLQERGALANFNEIWPRGAHALAGLNPYRLSQHSVGELEDIIGSVGGEFTSRLNKRAADLIVWADAFWRIRQIYGSFRQYIRSFDVEGHDALVGDLSQRLVGLTPKLLLAFLRAAGEKIPNLPQFERPAAGPRQGRSRSHASSQPRGGGQSAGKRRRGRGGGNQGKPAGGHASGTPRKGQQKPPDADKGKSPSKNRKGRRAFFRRKRAARDKATKR